MMYKFGQISKERVATCKPDLQLVLNEAIATAPEGMDFTVLEGVRSRKQMMVNYGKGRTAAQCQAKGILAKYAQPKLEKVTWLNNPFASAHAADPVDGLSKAADVAPYPIDWNDSKRFTALAEHILATAKRLKIKLRWGRDWNMNGRYEEKGETDGPHFELVK
jgi:peptidoglycan LD-endopeptidase CwlK